MGYLKKTSEEDLSDKLPKVDYVNNDVGQERFLFKENGVTNVKT